MVLFLYRTNVPIKSFVNLSVLLESEKFCKKKCVLM
jgi:hypothetical protein